MIVLGGSTDVTTYFALRLAADGTDATGLTITNFDLQYVRSGATPAAKVDATALGAANSAHADNQAIEVDQTDQPGLYRVDWPDAAFATGVREVILTVKCATAFTEHLRVTLDLEDAVWDALKTDHEISDTFGELANDTYAVTASNSEAIILTYQATVEDADGTNIAADIIALAAAVATVDTEVGVIDGIVDAIKAKTDSLTFTVAGQVDANIQYVNDVQVTGDGETGTEWGPA